MYRKVRLVFQCEFWLDSQEAVTEIVWQSIKVPREFIQLSSRGVGEPHEPCLDFELHVLRQFRQRFQMGLNIVKMLLQFRLYFGKTV